MLLNHHISVGLQMQIILWSLHIIRFTEVERIITTGAKLELLIGVGVSTIFSNILYHH